MLDGDRGWRESALVPATFVHADRGRDRARARRAGPRAGPVTARRVGRGLAPTPTGPRSRRWTPGWPRSTSRSRARRSRRSRPPCRTGPRCGPATRCRSATWTAGCRRPSARSRCARTAARTGSTASCRRCSGRPRSLPGRSRSSSATCRSCTTSTRCVAAKLHGLSATIVLVNNDGGGIFSFLPQASAAIPGAGLPEQLRGAVRDAARDRPRADRDGVGRRARPWSARRISGRRPSGRSGCPGVQVLELRTDRARNVALHREVAAVVAAAIRP